MMLSLCLKTSLSHEIALKFIFFIFYSTQTHSFNSLRMSHGGLTKRGLLQTVKD